jgi:hypothetical protein
MKIIEGRNEEREEKEKRKEERMKEGKKEMGKVFRWLQKEARPARRKKKVNQKAKVVNH